MRNKINRRKFFGAFAGALAGGAAACLPGCKPEKAATEFTVELQNTPPVAELVRKMDGDLAFVSIVKGPDGVRLGLTETVKFE